MKKGTIWNLIINLLASELRVILDTNIILGSIHPFSKYKILLESFFDEKYEIAISNEILLEYEELITAKFNIEIAKEFIDNLYLSNTFIKVSPSFKYNLISNDPDDNKFIDCYIASESDYLVTNDRHFNKLKKLKHPKINILSIDEFYDILHRV